MQGRGVELVSISSTNKVRDRVHHGQIASPSQRRTGQATMHPHTLTAKSNLVRPINLTCMFLDCGRKAEYQERTHICKGRTCELHAERPQAQISTQEFLAARKQLHHRVAAHDGPNCLYFSSIKRKISWPAFAPYSLIF
ncbi:hypothetical protein GOODEAATRI_034529 [Goodea atripinnis]|uniref:Uncharacterized protein n=1 Tax=Goodea atripinnis TaxID=208336 RepID=A0ABV0N6K2_9TELE